MICPHASCGSTIPDDSWFCDQCGREIFRCPKCGELRTGKFCTKDGIKTLPLRPPEDAPSPRPSEPQESELTKTIRASAPPSTLVLVHAGGETLEFRETATIGRRAGPHAAYLSAQAKVSGQHGKLVTTPTGWVYLDVGSTNGSRLNGIPCVAMKEYPLKAGDVLELADQKFGVR